MLYYEFVQRYPSISWPGLDLILYSDLETGSLFILITVTTHRWTNHRSGIPLSGGGIQAGGKTSFDSYHLRPTPHAIAALITSNASNIAKRLRWYNWRDMFICIHLPFFKGQFVEFEAVEETCLASKLSVEFFQGRPKPVWNGAQLQSTFGFCGSWPQPGRAATGLVAFSFLARFFCESWWSACRPRVHWLIHPHHSFVTWPLDWIISISVSWSLYVFSRLTSSLRREWIRANGLFQGKELPRALKKQQDWCVLAWSFTGFGCTGWASTFLFATPVLVQTLRWSRRHLAGFLSQQLWSFRSATKRCPEKFSSGTLGFEHWIFFEMMMTFLNIDIQQSVQSSFFESNAEIQPLRPIIAYARTKIILAWNIWGVLSASRWPTLLEYFSARWATRMGFSVTRMQYGCFSSWKILDSLCLVSYSFFRI